MSTESIIFTGFRSNEQEHQNLLEDQQQEDSENNETVNTNLEIPQGLSIKDVDWSIEVVLATNTMQQPAANGVPIVNLTLTLSDDSVVQRRLTASELHKWRYTLARATKDLQVIASRQPPPEKPQKSSSKK